MLAVTNFIAEYWSHTTQPRIRTEMARQFGLNRIEKRQLRNQLYERDGRRCHYCRISEDEFYQIWGGPFYGGFKRGRRLEVDRKVGSLGYGVDNCVLACAICNMAKSDKFSYDEFKTVGKAIREIWQNRKSSIKDSKIAKAYVKDMSHFAD